jgi:hypothetical protein
MACRLAVIEQFAGLTAAEGRGAFWKQKSPIDLPRLSPGDKIRPRLRNKT